MIIISDSSNSGDRIKPDIRTLDENIRLRLMSVSYFAERRWTWNTKRFSFEVKMMPVPKEIANGQTVEIRLTIQRTGNYNNTQYYLRYFQFDGQGTLQRHWWTSVLTICIRAPAEQFRLYYLRSPYHNLLKFGFRTAFGNEKQLSFEFNKTILIRKIKE